MQIELCSKLSLPVSSARALRILRSNPRSINAFLAQSFAQGLRHATPKTQWVTKIIPASYGNAHTPRGSRAKLSLGVMCHTRLRVPKLCRPALSCARRLSSVGLTEELRFGVIVRRREPPGNSCTIAPASRCCKRRPRSMVWNPYSNRSRATRESRRTSRIGFVRAFATAVESFKSCVRYSRMRPWIGRPVCSTWAPNSPPSPSTRRGSAAAPQPWTTAYMPGPFAKPPWTAAWTTANAM
jgi:hypothetical protein